MSVTLRGLLLGASLIAVVWILLQIRKFKVKMEDAIFWVFFAAVLLVLAVFPEVTYWLSGKMGFMSPSNLVFLVMIFLLVEKIFTLSIIVSQLEEKISVLSAEVALRSQAADKRIDHAEPLESAPAESKNPQQEKGPAAESSPEQEKGPAAESSPEQEKGPAAESSLKQEKGSAAESSLKQEKGPAAKSRRKHGKNRADGNPQRPEGSL